VLVLDEMNLAHVERYFADVLSGMESEYPCLPNLAREEDGLWRIPVSAAPRLPVPYNLIVVGTVNVDETTYMFSPKVLDRANTFEFRVETGDLDLGHQKPVPIEPGDPALVAGFLAIASDSRWHLENPAPGQDVFTQHLRTVHRLLAEGGFEFGHRVFYEAVRFAAMFAAAGDDDPIHALDLQIMQKVLPRLHGSRRRLEATLCAVAQFCHDLSFDEQAGLRDVVARFDPLQVSTADAKLPTSFAKVARMTRTLRANQFVSFTE
jgi:5-methylcytosine-specific restriction protein B